MSTAGSRDVWTEPIAIVGIAARLPGNASSVPKFWELLKHGESARTEIPPDRFNANAFYHPDPDRSDSSHVRHGHFLEGDIAEFDAPFFSIQPNEAVSMDPQQRLLLEETYHALENAGIRMEDIAGTRTGVYIGAAARDYEAIVLRETDQSSKYLGTGIGTALIANRISWFLDLKGPSLVIDTGCSGSLVALHHACQALRSGEIDTAIVGGVSLILSPDVALVHLSNMGFFSPDGKCYSFDDRANGYAKGEGVAVVVIKRLSDAHNDGNTIRSVIRATSSNQDGYTPGLTNPSVSAQVDNIMNAYKAAGLENDLDLVQYFEAHGTGTQVGDTTEAEAIHQVFRRTVANPLIIGALKTRIGHLEAASGIAGLIKLVLVLENGLIPANLWHKDVNRNIPADSWGLKFPLTCTPWPESIVRRASLNSFGYGGTNAHAILESYTESATSDGPRYDQSVSLVTLPTSNLPIPPIGCSPEGLQPDDSNVRLVVLSAADENGLKSMISSYAAWFSTLTQADSAAQKSTLNRMIYTLSQHRSRLPWKAHAVVKTLAELTTAFTTRVSTPIRSSLSPSLIIVFSGQGATYAQMAQDLRIFPVYHAALLRADAILQSMTSDWSIMSELSKPDAITRVHEPHISQPLCTTLQLALIDLMDSWSIIPDFVVGHSSGEIAAAYAAGAITFEEAIKVAFFRGVVAVKVAASPQINGAMMSIGLSREEASALLRARETDEHQVEIGCINSDKNVTLTGSAMAIEALERELNAVGVFAKRLAVNVPYHSSFMPAVADEYQEMLDSIFTGTCDSTSTISPTSPTSESKPPRMISSVTGREIWSDTLRSSAYWVQNLNLPVDFLSALPCAIRCVNEDGTGQPCQVVEIGPHAVLQRPVKDILALMKVKDFEYASLLSRGTSPCESIVHSMGRLWCRGLDLDASLIRPGPLQVDALQQYPDMPSYPFNHSTRYWHEGRLSRNYRFRQYGRRDLLGTRVIDWNPEEPRWRHMVRFAENSWIEGFQINNTLSYWPAAMLIMAIEALRQLHENDLNFQSYEFANVHYYHDLIVSESTELELQIILRANAVKARAKSPEAMSYDFTIFSFANGQTIRIAAGTVIGHNSMDIVAELRSKVKGNMIARVSAECDEVIGANQYYSNLEGMGYKFDASSRQISLVRYCDNGSAVSHCEPTECVADTILHPTRLNAIMQTILGALSSGSTLPIPAARLEHIESLWVAPRRMAGPGSTLQVASEILDRGFFDASYDMFATDSRDEPAFAIFNGRMRTESSLLDTEAAQSSSEHAFALSWKLDPTLMSATQMTQWMNDAASGIASNLTEAHEDYQELVCLHYYRQALQNLSDDDIVNMPSHLQRYVDWMRAIHDDNNYDNLLRQFPDFLDPEASDSYLSATKFASAASDLMLETGRVLESALRGETDPLDVLFRTDLAERYYANELFQHSYAKITAYLDLLAHKQPGLRILEIGAGTGGATVPILRILGSTNPAAGIARFEEYMYTDISLAFFEKAKERFDAKDVARMKFEVLDVDKDIAEQGFALHSYDVVICSGVLHICKEIRSVLENVRQLLKPTGKLVMFEPTNASSCRAGFTFGLLPGWWASEEEDRRLSPLISPAMWDLRLSQSGFTETQFWPTWPEPSSATHNIIITSVAGELPASIASGRDLVLLKNDASSLQSQVADGVRLRLEHAYSTITASTLCLERGSVRPGATYVVLLELDDSVLSTIQETEWEALKEILDQAHDVLWVTLGAGQVPSIPEHSLATGFGRTMMSEKLGLRFAELALPASSTAGHVTTRIEQILTKLLSETDQMTDTEHSEEKGLLCIPRLVEHRAVNDSIRSRTITKGLRVPPAHGNRHRSFALAIQYRGDFDTLCFRETTNTKALAKNELKINVHAAVVGTLDVQIAQGQQSGAAFGSQCSGVVTEAGSSSIFQPGDRVCCLVRGAVANSIRIKDFTACKIPANMTTVAAANLLVPFTRAYFALMCVAQIRQGISVLILGDEGLLAQAAVHIAQRIGAKVLLYMAGSEEDQRDAPSVFSTLPAHQILWDDFVSAPEDILSTSGQESAPRIIINTSSPARKAEWAQLLAPFGTFIDLEADPDKRLPAGDIPEGAVYRHVDFVSLLQSKHEETLREVMLGVRTVFDELGNEMPSFPAKQFSVADLIPAFRELEAGQPDATLVIRVEEPPSDPLMKGPRATKIADSAKLALQTEPELLPNLTLDPDATYLIGGTGGIARAIVTWMYSRGARNVLMISRSGESKAQTKAFLQKQRTQGLRVEAVACDLSDKAALQQLFDKARQMWPPIRGVVQASMSLKEGILLNMSVSGWHAALKPKVQGSRNLHDLLPRGLDFFILLSSVSGITGCRSQANYNSACTYQDALARHRYSIGERAHSIALGTMTGIGYAAEAQQIDMLKREGYLAMRKQDLFSILEHCCDVSRPIRSVENTQIICGLRYLTQSKDPQDTSEPVYWTRNPNCAILHQMHSSQPTTTSSESDASKPAQRLQLASSEAEAEDIVIEAFAHKLSRLMSVPLADIDASKPIYAYGLDSLVSLEIRYWLQKEIGADLSVTEIMLDQSLKSLARVAVGRRDGRKEGREK